MFQGSILGSGEATWDRGSCCMDKMSPSNPRPGGTSMLRMEWGNGCCSSKILEQDSKRPTMSSLKNLSLQRYQNNKNNDKDNNAKLL